MYENLLEFLNQLIYVPDEGMVHPGLPAGWIIFIFFSMIVIGLRYTLFFSSATINVSTNIKNKKRFQYPAFNKVIKFTVTRPWILIFLRLFAAVVFLTVIYAGLFGTPIPEKNIATVLTWTLWWSGVVISVFLLVLPGALYVHGMPLQPG